MKQYRETILILIIGLLILSMLYISCSDDDDDDDDSNLDRWTFMIWMNGDNNLEYLVAHDLNELEQVGSGNGLHVLVQADRIEGYATNDGDWTDTRRYYIEQDDDLQNVTSPVIEELGEIDMGSPDEVSDFLLWAHTNYPAENYVFIFWNHGDGWSAPLSYALPVPYVSWDDTSGNYLSIAEGDIREAFAEFVALRGSIEVVGFDACNMGAWEVAHSLRDQALTMTGSEAWVDGEGYMYATTLEILKSGDEVTPQQVAIELSRAPVEEADELTFSAIDLSTMDNLAAAIDTLAGNVLDDPSLEAALLDARRTARGADDYWKDWYLDLKDFAHVLRTTNISSLVDPANQILSALDSSVLAAYGNPPYDWTGGLSIFFDLTYPGYLELYHSGEGATWSEATRWDDLLLVLADHDTNTFK